MKPGFILTITAAALASGAAAWQIARSDVKLPPPFATPSANNRPHVVDKPSGAALNVPAGFSVDVWAEGFDIPRYMLQGNNGEILLSDMSRKGVVYAFPNGDPAKRKELIKGLDRPYGLALWKNYLYVGEPTSIKRYKYDGSALTAGPGEEVVSYAGFDKGHITRSILFDRAGQKMYIGVGSESNVDAGGAPERAAINRYNPDGSGHDLYATGTRNPIGLHWYPGTDTLWAAVQERDALGDDLVPDYFTHIQQGGFYGWPYAYFGPHEDPRRKGEKPDLVAKTITPDISLGAHVAVLDFTFYTGKQFPAEYRDGAFLAFHGSWNRSKRVGQSVAFIPFKNGKPTAEQPKPFLTGWMLSPDSRDVWGRTVAVFQMQDGSLLVSDDGGKKIWKITYKG
ncbi:MAG: PQQ-dependent sugar dehydrogenase [Acidobacteriota bacterium]|nr:PQQ-dependent sugar dehydrogenase [Acidobacteriota bacterium]